MISPNKARQLTDDELDAMCFPGIHIPHEVAFNKHTNIVDKFILMYIGSYKSIHYSDRELGEMFSTNPEVIGQSINHLLKLNYIKQVPDDTYIRVLETNWSWQYTDDDD